MRPRLLAFLLALSTLAVFLPVAQNGFINYDDGDYVFENNFVQSGLTWAGIFWAFTTFHASNWHPLTWLSHMLDCQLFGANAGAQHFVNVLFHAANVALLFILLLQLTGKIWPCALIAALFAWHPLHVESVAWISERKDVLSTFFALLALLSYTNYARRKLPTKNRKPLGGLKISDGNSRSALHDYFLALIFFALGLLSKPMLVTLPFIFLLLDFWPLQRMAGWKNLIFEKIAFFMLTLASCVVTFVAQNHGAVKSLKAVPLAYRLENAPVALADYLAKLFWPTHLAIIYPMPDFIPAGKVIFSVVILILISLAAWQLRKTKPYFLVGWLWFLGTLVPVLGLVKVGDAALADRYTYFPSIGFFLAAVFLARDFFLRLKISKIFAATFSVFILAACILATENQLRFWRNDETLFYHAIQVTQNNADALINYGVALEKENRLSEALAQYRAAEKIAPESLHVHNNLGNLLDNLGRRDEAVAEYQIAIRLAPNRVATHDSLGIVFVEMGKFSDGLNEFSNAAQLAPKNPWPYFEMGQALLKQGRDLEAVEKFREAVKRAPEDFEILSSVAHVFAAAENADARDGKLALTLASKANALTDGEQPLVLDVLGMACAETGDFTNAVICAQNALDLAQMAKLKNVAAIQQRLELFQNHQPWRESFLATNLPAKN